MGSMKKPHIHICTIPNTPLLRLHEKTYVLEFLCLNQQHPEMMGASY